MLYFIYDRTFEGLLCAVFDTFSRKEIPDRLVSEATNIPLFTDTYVVVTEPGKAERVLKGLSGKISRSAIYMLHASFLSESEEVENTIFRYIYKAFRADKSIELNFADPDILELSKVYRKVTREAERMRQFVRFQKTADGVFFACVEPRYNVMPLTLDFFEDRFADQQWLIYDVKRHKGWFYNLQTTEEVRIDNPGFDASSGKLNRDIMDDNEIDFQDLWKQYFKSISIKERENLKLQRQHMPERFWKFLTEK
ncbi:MAG: TIGR03915 family putative DNA repair protein [Dysgonamonadaceae bacterium]|jgi:probable DNA metabolism protein|nr:TIGR03915 family putative DNA repair protein [Dysgonamonadaceae bacterium]